MSRFNAQQLKTRVTSMAKTLRNADTRLRWRRERFLDLARRYTPVVGIHDYAGKRYLIKTSDAFIGRELFINGEFDMENIDNMLDLLSAHDLALEHLVDVGANIGTTVVEVLSRIPAATACAFEPEPANFRLLSQNIIGNDLQDRVVCRQEAISDTDGTLTFELSPDNPGDHRVRVSAEAGAFGEESWPTTTVQAWRLDSLVEQGVVPIDKSTLVWIDAQGHEAQIFAGAAKLVGRVPMVVEFWPYGLRRAGRYEAFIDTVGGYPSIFDIHGKEAHRVSPADLAALGGALERDQNFTELLLIPGR
jgi:FkbM family methyltransferase